MVVGLLCNAWDSWSDVVTSSAAFIAPGYAEKADVFVTVVIAITVQPSRIIVTFPPATSALVVGRPVFRGYVRRLAFASNAAST